MNSGPILEALTRRLGECPPEFLGEPRMRGKPGIAVAAVVADLLEDLGAPRGLSQEEAARWECSRPQDRNYLRLVLVGCWLCHDAWLRARDGASGAVKRWLSTGLRPLAGQVTADLFVTDPDRREELARLLLEALELTPEGETAEAAADRLRSLNSVERARIVRETREQQERARRLREQMEAEQARQAAARYSPE